MIHVESTPPLEYRATHALVFHESASGNRHGNRGNVVLTSHPIQQSSQGPLVGPGSAVTLADQDRLMSVLTGNLERAFDLLPERVLAVGPNRMLWWIRAARRPMLYRSGEHVTRLMVPWPALVALAHDRELSIAALHDSTRPQAKTKLFHAPFANVYEHSGVCTGNASLPDSCDPSRIMAWESVIFDTAFTEVHHGSTVQHPDGSNGEVDSAQLFNFWKSLHHDQAEVFPVEALVSLTTLSRWMQA